MSRHGEPNLRPETIKKIAFTPLISRRPGRIFQQNARRIPKTGKEFLDAASDLP